MPTASKMNSGTMMMAVNCGSKMIKINAKNSHDQIMDDLALARFWKLLASPRNIRISALKLLEVARQRGYIHATASLGRSGDCPETEKTTGERDYPPRKEDA